MPTPHHTDFQRAAKRPTRRQLAYLKTLADRAGQTFTYPISRQEASMEIARLKRATPSTRTERRVEHKVIADAIATGPLDSSRVRDDELVGYGSSATWAQNQATEPVDPAPRVVPRLTPQVGPRSELARYTVPAGQRVIYGQRVDGIVSFLPDDHVVLDEPRGGSEDDGCRRRESVDDGGRPNATRRKRPNVEEEQAAGAEVEEARRLTGARVELARYSVSGGDRVLYAQRVLGVLRVTDVPQGGGVRAYLVERGLEQEGLNAGAALRGLITDYLHQASVLDEVPMAVSLF
jgi:hypothetical protein